MAEEMVEASVEASAEELADSTAEELAAAPNGVSCAAGPKNATLTVLSRRATPAKTPFEILPALPGNSLTPVVARKPIAALVPALAAGEA
jgi:hypothetical protein